MAKYSDIKGFTVQTLSTDTVASQAAGGSWASGGSLNTARTTAMSSGSGNDNAIVAGGYLVSASPVSQVLSESYNGTAWTETNDLNTARQFGQGLGTNTAAIIVGGPPSTSSVEQWNGSSWTEVSEVNTGRILGAALGTTTAGLYAGGGPPPGGQTNVESWNGSSWTETSYDLNTGKYYMWGTGINTNAIVSGTPTTTEEFDGSSWTETTESSTDHRSGASAGIKTDALVYCGDNGPGYVAKTELWNGSSWTELNDLSQSKAYTGGTENAPSGTASALSYGGSTPSQTTSTEEWDAPAVFSKITEGQLFFNSTTNTFKETITDIPGASFASGGNMNSPGSNAGGASNGTPTATLVFAGDRPSRVTNTEQYDGSSWTEVNDMNTGSNNLGGFGLYNAANGVGGGTPSASDKNESWNGTSWTEVNNLNTARTYVAGCGLQTAGLAIGNSPNSGITEDFDGTSFTEKADLNTGRYVAMASGSPTAAIVTGGANPDDGSQAVSEQFDGTSWTEVADLNTGRQGGGRFGNKLSQIVAGGYNGTANVAVTEFFNGTSWTEVADLSIGRNSGGNMSSGTGTSAGIVFGGTAPGGAATEEWTADLANKTITAS